MATGQDRFEDCRELSGLPGTDRLASDISSGLARGDAVALDGDLGAGKTTLARFILQHLGVREAVPSPTFTLVQRYETKAFPVFHFDLYRIERASEISELALDEALADGVALIEWPERMADLPASTLHVRLDVVNEDTRRARITGPMRWASVLTSGSDATRG